jgi:hypothetical protein
LFIIFYVVALGITNPGPQIVTSRDREYTLWMVAFKPINCGVPTIGTLRVHAINLTLSLFFGQVRIMNSHYILKLRIDSKPIRIALFF